MCLRYLRENTVSGPFSSRNRLCSLWRIFPGKAWVLGGWTSRVLYSFVFLPPFQHVAWPWDRSQESGVAPAATGLAGCGGGAVLWSPSGDPFIVCISSCHLERCFVHSFTQLFGILLRPGCAGPGKMQGPRHCPPSQPVGSGTRGSVPAPPSPPPKPWRPRWPALGPFVPTDQCRNSGWAGSLPLTSCLSSVSLRRKFFCSAILA